MISLAYYLRVIAAIWMRPAAGAAGDELPAMAGGSPEADGEPAPFAGPRGNQGLVIGGLTVLAAAATVFFGVIPSPLVDWASHAGSALSGFIPS